MAKKIMIIDDEADLCEILSQGLTDNGYKTYQAFNGQDGLKLIEEVNPHLLLLDIRLPGMDGFAVMQEIIKRFPNLIVVVMTGMHDVTLAKRAIELGACECLTKPINLQELVSDYIRPVLGE